MADVIYLRSYDDRTREDDETARRVRDATVELLRDVPYSSITMRSIATRAGVSHGEIRAHYRSTEAIVAEIYLERLRAAPLIVDVEKSARARIAAQFSQLVMLLADEPGLGRGVLERVDLRRAVRAREPPADPRRAPAAGPHGVAIGGVAGGRRDAGVRADRRLGARQLRGRHVPPDGRGGGWHGGRRVARVKRRGVISIWPTSPGIWIARSNPLVHLAIARRRHTHAATQVVAQVATRTETRLPGDLVDGQIARLQ
jgi:AcrR family transcriptional regulator